MTCHCRGIHIVTNPMIKGWYFVPLSIVVRWNIVNSVPAGLTTYSNKSIMDERGHIDRIMDTGRKSIHTLYSVSK